MFSDYKEINDFIKIAEEVVVDTKVPISISLYDEVNKENNVNSMINFIDLTWRAKLQDVGRGFKILFDIDSTIVEMPVEVYNDTEGTTQDTWMFTLNNNNVSVDASHVMLDEKDEIIALYVDITVYKMNDNEYEADATLYLK